MFSCFSYVWTNTHSTRLCRIVIIINIIILTFISIKLLLFTFIVYRLLCVNMYIYLFIYISISFFYLLLLSNITTMLLLFTFFVYCISPLILAHTFLSSYLFNLSFVCLSNFILHVARKHCEAVGGAGTWFRSCLALFKYTGKEQFLYFHVANAVLSITLLLSW